MMVSTCIYLQLVANVDYSVIVIVVKKYQEEVKQLQQELEQRQKMGRARDVMISNLVQEKSRMQKKSETE